MLPHFEHAVANWPDIAQIAQRRFTQPGSQAAARQAVFQATQPMAKLRQLFNCVHKATVAKRLQIVKD
jgi:hypothetical protein